jgi:hypothetical protein
MNFRFTEREARFLALVMRHAGVCVPRQYASFAGVAHGGAKSNRFFAKLIKRGYATVIRCVHNRARIFHVHSKALYFASGEPNTAYRRPVAPRVAIERLMTLDGVLAGPDLNWVTTRREKAAYVLTLGGSGATSGTCAASSQTLTSTARAVAASGFPIGLDPSDRLVLLYVVTAPWTADFRRFLQERATLLRLVPAWTLRLVFVQPNDRWSESYEGVIDEELKTPLQPATIVELKAQFERRRARCNDRSGRTYDLVDIGSDMAHGERFQMLYRRWLRHGDAAFESVLSTAMRDALVTGCAEVQPLVLPHSYRHLLPLVDPSRSIRRRQKAELTTQTSRGMKRPHVLNPGPQPPVADYDPDDPAGCARDWQRLNDWYNRQKALGPKP